MQAHWFYTALLADVGGFLSPLAISHSIWAFSGLLGIHALAAGVLALAMFPALPGLYRQQKASMLLLFIFSFMAPVVGPVAVVLLVRFGLGSRANQAEQLAPQTIGLPEFDLRSKTVDRTAQGAIRSRLAKQVPEKMRMQSLLTLQAVPNAVANPILEGLLSDDTDDIRLIAFGMLDAKEKALSQLIQREQTNLDVAGTEEQRYECLCNLAELNWELIYASLVQGELRQHMLQTALVYVEQALHSPEAAKDGALSLLQGRILMALGRLTEAEAALERSLHLDHPDESVLPYLAELAYRRHDHGRVHRLMATLSEYQMAPRVRSLVDLWTGRDSTKVFRDRRILPHL